MTSDAGCDGEKRSNRQLAWLEFFLSALTIVVAGTLLSRYGDRIAEQTGLGGLWIGVVFMAAATSLPELLTAVSASWLDAPNLAVGDLMGAGMSNMLTLGVIDLLHRRKRVWQHAALEHALIASLAMALTGLAGMGLLLRRDWTYGHVGLATTSLALIYILGMRLVYRQEAVKRQERELEKLVQGQEPAGTTGRGPDRGTWIGFAAAALGIVIAAPFLAASAKAIAVETGISTTFVGTSLLAIATSLPEFVTAVAAVRLGAFDLAVGNLFGSNAFNMCALFAADVAYGQGPLLTVASPVHAVTALWVVILMNVGLMGILYRAEKRFLLIEPDSLLMILGYALGMWVLFRIGG